MSSTRLPALVIALLAALAGGCGAVPSAPAPSAPVSSAPVPSAAAGPTSDPAPPDPNRALSTVDIEFLATMLGHHAAAQQMTALAEQRATAPGVQAFAAASRTAQQREIDDMRGWLVGLGVDPAEVGGHDHNGHVSEQDLTDLAALTGPAFDRRFLDLLGTHDVDAMALAKDEATDGFNTDVRQLAAEITRREWSDLETVRRLG